MTEEQKDALWELGKEYSHEIAKKKRLNSGGLVEPIIKATLKDINKHLKSVQKFTTSKTQADIDESNKGIKDLLRDVIIIASLTDNLVE
jgi:hypothetical protein